MQINHNRFLGYTKDEKKQLIIDLEGDEVVKRIYREYLKVPACSISVKDWKPTEY